MNIKEIAKLVGVSSATVSRVLNDSGYVKTETREKVLQVIKEHKYIPSAIARSLSNKETNSIGTIIPDIQNEFFAKLISGITESADRLGYNTVLLNSNEDINKEHEILSMVEAQHFKGIIITPVAYNDTVTGDFLLHFEDVGIPVVLVDRDIRSASFAGVFVDNFKGAFDGVNELIKANHKRIAIISGPETSRPGKDRYRGYIAALEEQGLAIEKKYIVHGDFKVDKAYECTKQLLSLEEKPTAIFTSNNLTTMGCLKYLTENNIELGKDISVLGFDDIDALKMIGYNISVVSRDAGLQGEEAMELLQERFIKKDSVDGKQVMVPYKIILRGSEKCEHQN